MTSTKLLIVGDSISMGATEVMGDVVIARVQRSYVDNLRELMSPCKIECDAALHRTTIETERLLPGLLSEHCPGIVLLQVGGNDVDIDWRRFMVSGGKRIRSCVSVESYGRGLRECVEHCRSTGAQAVLSDFPKFDLETRKAWMIARVGPVARAAFDGYEHNAEEELHRRFAEYTAMLISVAREISVPLARWSRVLDQLELGERFGPDGVHPGAAAHPLIAAVMAECLADVTDRGRANGTATPANHLLQAGET